MAQITTKIDDSKALTIITVSGELTAEEVFEATSRFYTEAPTPNLIWDFSTASISISCDNLKKIVSHIDAISEKRTNGRTAFIKSKHANAGLGNMFSAFAGIQGLPYDYKIFFTLEDAIDWLDTKEA